MRKLTFIIWSLVMISLSANSVKAENGYKLPPQKIQEIFDTPKAPIMWFLPFSETAIEYSYRSYETLEQISEPTLKLAGIEFSPKLNAAREKYPTISLTINHFNQNQEIPVELPENTFIRQFNRSNDNSKIACTYETEEGVKLFILDVETGKINWFEDILLNDLLNENTITWFNDNKTLLLKTIPQYRGEAPVKPHIPSTPVIQETNGKVSTVRTYQNLLKNKFEESQFEYYFSSQLITLNTKNGKTKMVSKPGIIDGAELSPDNKHLLVFRIKPPYSYLVPYYYFPETAEVISLKGKPEYLVYDRPMQDQIPIGGTIVGPRNISWQPHEDATLYWTEALDEGDPKVEVPQRDKFMNFAAPFNDQPSEFGRTKYRHYNTIWSEEKGEFIYYEYDRDRLWRTVWLKQEGKEPEMLFDQSTKDRYNDPGSILRKRNSKGELVYLKQGTKIFLNNTTGASPEGNFPYLAKFDLNTKNLEKIFTARSDKAEKFIAFFKNDFKEIIVRSEDPEHPRNYFRMDLAEKNFEPITSYPNPYPELTGLKKEFVKYTRADSVQLSGTLYLPPNYKKGDKLPLVIHAYPREFTDKATAGQVSGNPNTFISFWGSSIKYLVFEGYAVLANASMPIIGDPETVNETFKEQLISNVEAAINFLDNEEIIDPAKVGIIGHSYGAFMVANILANTDICAAGIAKSGAYNRTLTPFGFQSERRTLWEAKDFYVKVSPFMQADKIKQPLMLIHGEDDPNSGTYPIQSKRFYQALKGNGATARLVLLPNEGHGYSARESNLHVLAEMIEWFDKYLKN